MASLGDAGGFPLRAGRGGDPGRGQFRRIAKDNREQTLTMLFAGIFDEANRTRGKAIDGIRRFSRAQQEQLRNMNATLGELDRVRAAQPEDTAKMKELTEQLAWQRRIIEERQRSLGALCEQPGDRRAAAGHPGADHRQPYGMTAL